MNLVLLHAHDFISEDTVRLAGRRARHLDAVHRAENGRHLRVGLVNGPIGTGTVTVRTETHFELKVVLDQPPPPAPDLTLILALPRPKSLKKALTAAVSMGVKKIFLLNSRRVDKSYWHSPLLQAENLQEQIILALEQAVDTMTPVIILKKRFKPFVEDEIPDLVRASRAILADPAADTVCPGQLPGPLTLAVGPEGGFIPYETAMLAKQGFQKVRLGARILRVEFAVAALLGRLISNE
jgi:RsmE family RNA methyltransferase